MKIIELNRIIDTEFGTFGTLQENKYTIAITLERRWLNNEQFVSCIPKGNYNCKLIDSSKGTLSSGKFANKAYWVQDVKDRTEITIHVGNKLEDIEGCISVARKFAVNKIQDSRLGMGDWMQHMEGEEEFILRVLNYGKVHN
jgi:hypothetical protein